ncbi:MAG: hypothetical protein ACXVRZ_06915 [Gaiellaceae bacterium]
MIAAISSSIGSTGLSLLGATNAAIESLARNLASELAPSFNGCEDYTRRLSMRAPSSAALRRPTLEEDRTARNDLESGLVVGSSHEAG